MTPAEIMRDAYDGEFSKWQWRSTFNVNGDFEVIRWADDGFATVMERTSEGRAIRRADELAKLAGHRAALRAFAEMEPTEEMEKASDDARMAVWPGKGSVAGSRAYILAAAAEGENQ